MNHLLRLGRSGRRRVVSGLRSHGVRKSMRLIWSESWMRLARVPFLRRLATTLATLTAPPYFGRHRLAELTRHGYVAPSARLDHASLELGPHVFLGDRVVVYQHREGGTVRIRDHVYLNADVCIETGPGGAVTIGARTHVHPRCHLSSHVAPIQIGEDVQIAPSCAIYSFDHGTAANVLVRNQSLTTKGPVLIGDGVWLGYGAIVLSGVRIGEGAVIGAGAVVTTDIPSNVIAVGNPARVIRRRDG